MPFMTSGWQWVLGLPVLETGDAAIFCLGCIYLIFIPQMALDSRQVWAKIELLLSFETGNSVMTPPHIILYAKRILLLGMFT